MPGVLSSTITAYRGFLAAAPASLVDAPATFDVEDLPAGKVHRSFRMTVRAGHHETRIYGGNGAASEIEYEAELGVELHWDPQVDAAGVWNTVADDIENLMAVMRKVGNRAGVQGLINVVPGTPIEPVIKSVNEIVAAGTFIVTIRVQQDLT
jgi:hypothetical protein